MRNFGKLNEQYQGIFDIHFIYIFSQFNRQNRIICIYATFLLEHFMLYDSQSMRGCSTEYIRMRGQYNNSYIV